MKPAVQNIVAGVCGVVAGGIAVAGIEGISSLVYPLPDGLDPYDKPAMTEYVKQLPVGAFVFVLTAWFVGATVGVAVARRIAVGRNMVPGIVACGLLLLGTVAMLFQIPHPGWFNIAGIAVYPAGLLVGTKLTAPPDHSAVTATEPEST